MILSLHRVEESGDIRRLIGLLMPVVVDGMVSGVGVLKIHFVENLCNIQ